MPSTWKISTVTKAIAVGSIGATSVFGATPQPAQPPSPAPPAIQDAAIDPELLRLRELAWRAWFAGDEAALRKILPPEFIGINMGDGPFSDLAKTIEESRAFRDSGGRLVHLEFPETRAQRLGEVVVLYGRYSAVIESEGKQRALTGRLTELFVLRSGRWWHPGWHLDLTPTTGAGER
jgi:hypothetical protein